MLDAGQIADQRMGLLAEVLEQGALDLGDGEQVDAAGERYDHAAVPHGVLDLHGPPPGGGRLPSQGFRRPG
jgi:hypothetical protein